MVSEVNLALFGSGYWGTKLASEYIQLHNDNEKFNFIGVADPDKDRLAAIGNKLNLQSSMLYNNIEQCFENPKVTAIHIATPNETHYSIAAEGLSRNKHVLLEKPMAMNSRDAFKLARLAEKNGQILLVGHIFKFNSSLARTKEILEKRQIGDVNYLQLSWLDYLNPLPDRDIIFDLLPHPVDILNYLTDEWPSSVYAQSASYRRPLEERREDMAFITMELPDKRLAQITLSWIQPGLKKRTVTITGSEGTTLIDAISQEAVIYRDNARDDIINITKNNTINSMISHFINCIFHKDNPRNSSLVGAMTVGVLSSARSLSEKRAVRVFE